MFEQHITHVKPAVHRCFKRFGLDVGKKMKSQKKSILSFCILLIFLYLCSMKNIHQFIENMKNIEEIQINFTDVPPLWSLCFQTDCPLRMNCLRFAAGKTVPSTLHHGAAVYPGARKDDKCSMFKQIRMIHAAWGFKSLFEDVKHADYTPLRDAIKEYLGSHTSYYRYHRGEKLLTPEQQQWILDLFAQYGYTNELHFDSYRDMIDFS